MFEIPDSLRSLFTGTVEEREDSYVIEVPKSEVEHDAVRPGGRYRVAVVDAAPGREQAPARSGQPDPSPPTDEGPPAPPVDEGEVRQVTVESIGDQGDGIAKVERGYVVIVPNARPGEQPTVEIEDVQQNVAFARIVDGAQPSG